jgi:hypothetical protein
VTTRDRSIAIIVALVTIVALIAEFGLGKFFFGVVVVVVAVGVLALVVGLLGSFRK